MNGVYRVFAAALALSMIVLAGCGREAASVPSTSGLRAAVMEADLPTISVDLLIRNPRTEPGRIAVHGVVVQRYVERGAFVMVDVEEFKSCGFAACTDALMPVRLADGAYDGVLPELGAEITVVGHYEPLERGFRFDPDQIHRDGLVILALADHQEKTGHHDCPTCAH